MKTWEWVWGQGCSSIHSSETALCSNLVTYSIYTLQYDKIGKLTREFEPFKNLWITAADWLKWHETWMNDSLINIDPELLANNVNNAFKTMHKSVKHFR